LDHITKGRIGWNIVTGYLDSAAKAKGKDSQVSHDERYDMADEYMEVVYRLWEESWEDGAVLRDVERGIFADPSKVHQIKHDGRYYRVNGVHLCEPSPQRTPVLYQAGTSPRGIAFAARHAECVFVSGPRPASVAGRVKRLRAAAAKLGRGRDDIQVLASMNIIVAPTDEEAETKHAEYSSYIDKVGSLVRLSAFTGTDLSRLAPDEPIRAGSANAIASIVENLTKGSPGKAWTVADVANSLNREGTHPIVVGSPQRVVDQLEA
jgi:FMN-dependent oxidoreductase (nitrilotriacetate monooxygenase family)